MRIQIRIHHITYAQGIPSEGRRTKYRPDVLMGRAARMPLVSCQTQCHTLHANLHLFLRIDAIAQLCILQTTLNRLKTRLEWGKL